MAVHMCPRCDYTADLDYNSDDFIGDTCKDCLNDMSIVELQAFMNDVHPSDKDYILEMIEERKEQ